MNDTQIWPTEPPMQIMDVTETHNEKAEKLNGRLAMLGVLAALGASCSMDMLHCGLHMQFVAFWQQR